MNRRMLTIISALCLALPGFSEEAPAVPAPETAAENVKPPLPVPADQPAPGEKPAPKERPARQEKPAPGGKPGAKGKPGPRERPGKPPVTLSPRELRELFEDDSRTVQPAAELIFGMEPKERRELRELYDRDHDAARQFIQDELDRARKVRRENAAAIRRLSRELREAESDEAKNEIRGRLREELTKEFNRTSAEIELRLKFQEQRLAGLRRAYEKRIADSDKIIDEQLDKLSRKRPDEKPIRRGKEK